MATLIAESVDVETAIAEEQALGPGLYEIRFYLADPVTHNDELMVRDYLTEQGVDVKRVYQGKSNGLWYLAVRYRKPAVSRRVRALPLAIIPLIAFGFVSALIGVGIFKIKDITENIGKIMLIGGGTAIVLVALLRKPAERVAAGYVSRR